jgi:ABC-type lipoprotein export system ATPase subunit
MEIRKMTKEELSKYLSGISGIKENIIDNAKYFNNLSNLSEQAKKQYEEFHKSIQTSVSKISEEERSKHKELEDILKPTLPEELSYLYSKYNNDVDMWKERLNELNILTKINQPPLAIDSFMYGSSSPASTPNTNHLKEKTQMSNIKINKIQLSNFRFFTDDESNNTFVPNKHGMLIYGENGSGKSSLFKAFEFLSKTEITQKEFKDNKNIFKYEEPSSLTFEFNNNKSLSITDDNLVVDGDDTFITNLSIFKPILNYQELLKISYNEHNSINEQKNLYTFFEKILEDYPIVGGGDKKRLKDFEDDEHFEHYKRIIEEELFDSINHFLEKFNHNFKITKIKLSGVGKKAHLEIDYFEKDITDKKYHLFLNEARLSALAMSIYFAIIKKQFDLLNEDSLKILVLDDLLISLDMNNRLNLLKILQDEFSDYQIFFFTHEKGLFDLINEKMKLESYEIYVQKKDDFEVPFIKQSKSLLEQAIWQKDTQNYGCSANLLRQVSEKLVCKFLPNELTVGDGCKILELDKLLNKAIKFETTKATNINQDIIDNLNKLKTFKRILLNDASHYNSTDIFKIELEDAINVLSSMQLMLD